MHIVCFFVLHFGKPATFLRGICDKKMASACYHFGGGGVLPHGDSSPHALSVPPVDVTTAKFLCVQDCNPIEDYYYTKSGADKPPELRHEVGVQSWIKLQHGLFQGHSRSEVVGFCWAAGEKLLKNPSLPRPMIDSPPHRFPQRSALSLQLFTNAFNSPQQFTRSHRSDLPDFFHFTDQLGHALPLPPSLTASLIQTHFFIHSFTHARARSQIHSLAVSRGPSRGRGSEGAQVGMY